MVLLLAASVRLYRSPRSASLLHVTPDSEEYAVSAQRLATLGKYDIEIEGRSWPPRSPPWFSALVLAPAYVVAPREIGAGIVPVLLCSLAGVLAAFVIGRRIAGVWGGATAVLMLLSSAVYRPWSREIMTDVPAAASGLWGCVLFLESSEGSSRLRTWALAGALVGGASALRSEYVLIGLPFAWLAFRENQRTLAKLILLTSPWMLVACATAAYDKAVFGEWLRTGYQFWSPIPCDYPGTVFSPAFLAANLRNLVGPWSLPDLLIGAAGVCVLLVRKSAEARGVLAYLMLAAVPGSLAHLVYFYTDARFHIFLLSLLCILGGAGLASLVPDAIRRRTWYLPALVVPGIVVSLREPDPTPTRRNAADAIAESTPRDAVVVSAIDPVYLEPTVIRGTQRRVVPVSRQVEYASKAVAWKRIPLVDRPGERILDLAPGDLIARGAQYVCEFTADERPDQLLSWVRQGRPVVVDLSFSPRQFPFQRCEELGLVLERIPGQAWLRRLTVRK